MTLCRVNSGYLSNKMIPLPAPPRRERRAGEWWGGGEEGEAKQARENRGARYRVTNSPTPEIHPFIGAHQVRGCIQERNRGLLLGSLFYLIVVSHGVLETEPTRCATGGFTGEKKGRKGKKKRKKEKRGRRVQFVTCVSKRRKKRDEKARES